MGKLNPPLNSFRHPLPTPTRRVKNSGKPKMIHKLGHFSRVLSLCRLPKRATYDALRIITRLYSHRLKIQSILSRNFLLSKLRSGLIQPSYHTYSTDNVTPSSVISSINGLIKEKKGALNPDEVSRAKGQLKDVLSLPGITDAEKVEASHILTFISLEYDKDISLALKYGSSIIETSLLILEKNKNDPENKELIKSSTSAYMIIEGLIKAFRNSAADPSIWDKIVELTQKQVEFIPYVAFPKKAPVPREFSSLQRTIQIANEIQEITGKAPAKSLDLIKKLKTYAINDYSKYISLVLEGKFLCYSDEPNNYELSLESLREAKKLENNTEIELGLKASALLFEGLAESKLGHIEEAKQKYKEAEIKGKESKLWKIEGRSRLYLMQLEEQSRENKEFNIDDAPWLEQLANDAKSNVDTIIEEEVYQRLVIIYDKQIQKGVPQADVKFENAMRILISSASRYPAELHREWPLRTNFAEWLFIQKRYTECVDEIRATIKILEDSIDKHLNTIDDKISDPLPGMLYTLLLALSAMNADSLIQKGMSAQVVRLAEKAAKKWPKSSMNCTDVMKSRGLK